MCFIDINKKGQRGNIPLKEKPGNGREKNYLSARQVGLVRGMMWKQ